MPESSAPPPRRTSLRLRLLSFLIIPMLVLLLLDATLIYSVARRYSEEVHDRDLAADALALANVLRSGLLQRPLSRDARILLGLGVNENNYIMATSRRFGLLGGNLRLAHPPLVQPGAPPRLFDATLSGRALRAASVSLPAPHDADDFVSVVVAEPLDERHLHAREILLLAVPLQALLILCVLGLVFFGVNRGLRSLAPITRKLLREGTGPVTDVDVPQEILPLTRTIDSLLVRQREALEVQEQFIADAAHQLRTPLAGLRLHVERAQADRRPEGVDDALSHIARLTERAARTATQLLTLTRAQLPAPTPDQHAAIALTQLVPEVIASRIHEAIARGIDLGYQGPSGTVIVQGDRASLHELLDNLLDNVLRYAGRGSIATVALEVHAGGSVSLVMEDDGPGVAAAYLARLGERFFRVPGAHEGGSGLGLAIVRRIADRHSATVQFANVLPHGLRVIIHFAKGFPPAAPTGDSAEARAPHASRRHLPVLLLGLAGGGCTTLEIPALAPPVPANWRHVVSAGSTPADLRGWWRNFHDPQLDDLVERALADNLEVAAAMERVRASRILDDRALARYLPQLRASTDNAIDPNARASYLVAGFDMSWESGWFGRREYTRRALRGNLASAAAQLDEVRVSLVGEVVADWLMLGAAHSQLQQLTQIRDLREKQLKTLRTRALLGLSAATPVAEAEAALTRAGIAILDASQNIDTNAQQLAALLGSNSPDPVWLQSVSMPRLGDWSLVQAPADLLRTRPEIVRAEAEVLHDAGEAGLARADLLPSIGLGGSIVWSTRITENRPTNAFRIGSFGPVVDIPLYDWGQRLARSRAGMHALNASVLAYRGAVLRGVSEVETALGGLERQHEREQSCNAVLAAAERSVAIMNRRLELSISSPLDVQAAKIGEYEARLQYTQATAGRGLAYVALFKALGGAPLPPVEPALGWRR